MQPGNSDNPVLDDAGELRDGVGGEEIASGDGLVGPADGGGEVLIHDSFHDVVTSCPER